MLREFIPRPAVLPWPEAGPRPTRLRFLVEPSAGTRSLISMMDPFAFRAGDFPAFAGSSLAGKLHYHLRAHYAQNASFQRIQEKSRLHKHDDSSIHRFCTRKVVARSTSAGTVWGRDRL